MNDSEEQQLGSWIGMLADTELYGGTIDNESKKIIESIISSYDNMPKGTRNAMKDAMKPMLEEMQNSEPILYAKASNIANGILSNLKKAFDIHSPSKKTREIFKNVMKGGELGIEEGKEKLYKKIDDFDNKVLRKFENSNEKIFGKFKDRMIFNIPDNMPEINSNIRRNINTTITPKILQPNIVINTQKLDNAEMNKIIDTLNRRFGMQF